jgi:hypothetical protein
MRRERSLRSDWFSCTGASRSYWERAAACHASPAIAVTGMQRALRMAA